MKLHVLKIIGVLVVCCVCTLSFAAEPATAPASESLMNGDLIFTPPDGWKLEGKAGTGRLAVYSHVNPKATLAVNVDPQQTALDASAAPKIGQMLVKKIKDNAATGKIQIIQQPKAELNAGFFLRIQHSYKKGDETAEQLQVYRMISKNLVAVACTAFTESPEEAKAIFTDAEKTLTGMHTSKQPAPGAPAHATAASKLKPATRPTALPQAKISFSAPAGWTDETNDNVSGIVATYHDPAESFNTIVISVRPLPPEAKKDPKLRDALVEEIVSGEKAQFKFDGAQTVGETEVIKDRRFLKKVRIRYEKPGAKIQVTSRTMRIGDQVVSIAMASLDPTAPDVDKLADDVAMTLKGR